MTLLKFSYNLKKKLKDTLRSRFEYEADIHDNMFPLSICAFLNLLQPTKSYALFSYTLYNFGVNYP